MKNQLDEILGKGRVREQVDLFPHLSLRLHTTAQYFFEAKTKNDLVSTVRATQKLSLPLIVLGGGTNVVFNQSVVSGLVVKNSYASITPISSTNTTADIEVGSGTIMSFLVQKLADKGLSGLEYHKGLPGTVGGAVYMNSKWVHPLTFVGDCVLSAVLIDRNGIEKKVNKEYFAFEYDYSILHRTHEIVASVIFRLQKNDKKIITEHMNESTDYRKKTQPSGGATCGCFFRNISDREQKAHALPTKSAGYLIDKAGMKGVRSGSFQVSDVHANFIINQGGDARPEDLVKLVQDIKDRVKTKFGVELREEVQIM